MKEKLKNKKVVYTIIGVISVLLVAIAVTYAYWLVTRTQTNENIISSGCLDINLSNESNDISLSNQFPMSDEEGMKLTPYTFTITNNCNTSVDYQVNLESFDVEAKEEISVESLKVALNLSGESSVNGEKLSTRPIAEQTIVGAKEARVIGYGTLASISESSTEDEATYELRIWIDEEADISEMNKIFKSKISVTASNEIHDTWIQKGTIVESLKTGQILEVGTDVSYDSGVSYYGYGWVILGAENGHLLLVSKNTVGTHKNLDGEYTGQNYDSGTLYETLVVEPINSNGQTFIQQMEEFDKICKPYVNSEYAVSSRSITVDDLNRITGYDPNKTGTGLPYGYAPEDNEDKPASYYGMEVTYKFNDNNIVEYSYVYNNQKVVDTYNGSSQYSNFWKLGESANAPELSTEEGYTIKGDNYLYYPTTLTASPSGDLKGISKDSLAYETIFNKTFWLNSSYTRPGNGKIAYGIYVYGICSEYNTEMCLKGFGMWSTNSGALMSGKAGIRAVVALKNDVKVSDAGVLSK